MKRTSLMIALFLTAALAGCSETVPTGDPAALLDQELRGYEAPVGVMMGLNETPYWVHSAVAEFRPAGDSDLPVKIEDLKSLGSCTFEAPRPEEILAKVQVDGSNMKSPVYAVSRQEMGERTKNYIVNLKAGHDIVPFNGRDDRMGIVDVVVTEKAKPVYLVIAYNLPTIFNLQLVEGARVSRIALIGFGAAGVANADPAVQIQSLTGKAMQSCNVMPVREPADHWLFVQNAKEDSSLKDALEQNFSMYRDFSAWYRKNFGSSSGDDSVGAMTASHVLVGPVPQTREARAKFKPLEGATLLLSKNDHIFVGEEAAYEKKYKHVIVDAATKMAGGDLSKLMPTQ
ncbi:MAG: hypothetical protein H7X89_01700 [Rhizobiales bacterium]|nr:hypothetical protein [Hyphomicrobiales bacterium]